MWFLLSVVTPAAARTQAQPTQAATRAMAAGGCPESGPPRTHPPPWRPHTRMVGSLTDHPPCDCPVSPAAAPTTSGRDPSWSLPSTPARCLHDNPKGAPAARGLRVVSWPFPKPTRLQDPGSVGFLPPSLTLPEPAHAGRRGPREQGSGVPVLGPKPSAAASALARSSARRKRWRECHLTGLPQRPGVPGSRGRQPINLAVACTSDHLTSAHPRSAAPEPGPVPPWVLPPGTLFLPAAQTTLPSGPRTPLNCLPDPPASRSCQERIHPPSVPTQPTSGRTEPRRLSRASLPHSRPGTQ